MNRLSAKGKVRASLIGLALFLVGLQSPVALAQRVSFAPAPGSPVGVGKNPTSIAWGDFNRDGNRDFAVTNSNDNTVSVYLGNGNGTFTLAPGSPMAVNRCSLDPSCGGVPIAVTIGFFDPANPLNLSLAVTNIPINASCLGSAAANNQPLQDVCSAVAIFLGNGDGTFQASTNYNSGGFFPTSVARGHFIKGGAEDLAVTNLDSGTVSIFLNKGDGTFNLSSTIPVGSQPTCVKVGDFNGDGKPDLAVTNGGDGTVTILTGNGDGTFSTATTLTAGNRPVSLAVDSFTSSGNEDLVVANQTDGTVSVFLGNGNGTFRGPTNFRVGASPISVTTSDFDNDGHTDIAVVNRLSDSVTILLGDGSGSFAPGSHVAVGTSPFSVVAADFNNDGFRDLAVANLSSNTVSVLLNNSDLTPPVTSASAMPPPNANGWNNTSVKVMLTATDNEPNGTGVKEIHYTIGANPEVVVAGGSATLPDFTSEGIYAISYHAVDNAGNVEAANSLTVQIDLTPPTITSSQSPPANGAGWNNTDVTVTFTCGDALSGVDTCTPQIVVSTEGANQVETGTATDKAGNTATTTRTINLDKTPPVLTMPVFAASYLLNSTYTFNFGATDALSGVATMQATLNGTPVTSGSTVTLAHLATNTFILTATDVAGNTSTQTATFAVVYNFIGFLPPIPNDGSGLFKLGSTVPVKFQLTDANGTLISTAVAHLTIQMISNNTLVGTPIDATAPGNADVGDLFRFDGTQYIFNWSTKPVSTGTWQLQARLDDGTVHTVVMGTK